MGFFKSNPFLWLSQLGIRLFGLTIILIWFFFIIYFSLLIHKCIIQWFKYRKNILFFDVINIKFLDITLTNFDCLIILLLLILFFWLLINFLIKLDQKIIQKELLIKNKIIKDQETVKRLSKK